MTQITGRKVIISRDEVAAFNRTWPCSELRDSRAYWFEFDSRGDLIDTDCPEHDDGAAASAMAADCYRLLFHAESADWMSRTVSNYESELVTRCAPRWAWDAIDEALDGGNESARRALAAMVKACEAFE